MTTHDPIAPSEPHNAVAERAAGYFQRRRFWIWTDHDQADLDRWLSESVLHEVAYLRLEGAAAHTERLVAHRPPEPLPDRLGRIQSQGSGARFLRWFPLLAAAVALIAVFGPQLLNSLKEPPDRVYSTDIGGRTLLSFADRTQIELNTDTLVRYRMTNRERTVWLEKGEAWFHVAHNAANPFTVIVGKHRVRDIGTEFDVRRGATGMEVALLNGRATLSTDGAQTATLRPGDDAVATAVSMSVTRRTPQELADEFAWRRGMLAFRNTKLADAVREVNRYNTTKLVIADPSIAGVKISADLKTDDFEGFVQFAQSVLNLQTERQGGVILISRRGARKFATDAVRQ